MKTKLLLLSLTLVASVGTMFAWDYERVQIDDLYYNLNTKDTTAEVAGWYRNNSYSGEYSDSIVIPTSVKLKGKNYNVTSIGDRAFYRCTDLTSIEIPNSIISIGELAFYGCTGLNSPIYNAHVFAYMPTSISGAYIIPDGIESIAGTVFYRCTGLTSVEIPNSVTSIGEAAFLGCTSLNSITIPNSVTSIGSGAFQLCSGLTSIEIPNSVISIGESPFFGCTGLTSIDVASDNPNYCSLDGVLFNTDRTIFISYPAAKTATSYSIPNSVTSIGSGAFGYCSSLLSVTIPNSVTSIGGAAFSECIGLSSIEIPNSVTSIGDGVFYGCTGLTSVTIPNRVTSIGENTFRECANLTVVTIPNSVKSIGYAAFEDCSSLTSIEIPNSVTRIGEYAFSGCIGLTSVTCYATTPPVLAPNSNSWLFVDISKIPLYVPLESVDAYKAAEQWKDFNPILPISASETETTGIQTTSTENTVDISWPAVTGAASYELVIKDAGGNKIYTLVFNANGQLVSLVFHAPARNNAPQQLQEAGFIFTITGLNPGTEYI